MATKSFYELAAEEALKAKNAADKTKDEFKYADNINETFKYDPTSNAPSRETNIFDKVPGMTSYMDMFSKDVEKKDEEKVAEVTPASKIGGRMDPDSLLKGGDSGIVKTEGVGNIPSYLKDISQTSYVPTASAVLAIKDTYTKQREQELAPPVNETLQTMSRIDWNVASAEQIASAFTPFGISNKALGLPNTEMEQSVDKFLYGFMDDLGLKPVMPMYESELKTAEEYEEMYVTAYKKATIPELGADAPLAERVEARMRGTAFDVASFGAGAKKEALPSTGSKVFDFVVDTAGAISGAMASGNVLGAGTNIYGAISQNIGRNVSAKTMAKIGSPQLLESKVTAWAKGMLPSLMAGSVDLTTITAARLVMTGEINELSAEDQIKMLATSALQGAIFGAITGTIKPFTEAKAMKKQGFSELNMVGENGKKYPTGVWMKGELSLTPDGGVWVGGKQVGTSLTEYVAKNSKVASQVYVQGIDMRNLTGRKGLYMNVASETTFSGTYRSGTDTKGQQPLLGEGTQQGPVEGQAMIQPTTPVVGKGPRPATQQITMTTPTGRVIPQPGKTETIVGTGTQGVIEMGGPVAKKVEPVVAKKPDPLADFKPVIPEPTTPTTVKPISVKPALVEPDPVAPTPEVVDVAPDVEKNYDVSPFKSEKAQKAAVSHRKKFIKTLTKSIGISTFDDTDALSGTVDKVINEIRANKTVSPENEAKLFDEIIKGGIVVDDGFYEMYKPLKAEIKKAKLYISDKVKSDFADKEYNEFRKANFANLTLTSDTKAMRVDSFYKELNESNPELFPDDITAARDQLERIVDIQNSIAKSEDRLSSFSKGDPEFEKFAREELSTALRTLEADVDRIAEPGEWDRSISINDIPEKTATRAYDYTSFDPKTRGESFRKSYVAGLKDVYSQLKKFAKTPEQIDYLDGEMDSFQKGYLMRSIDLLDSHSRIASPGITGPAKFPTARNNKRMDAYQNRIEKFNQWEASQIKRIKKKLKGVDPEATANEELDNQIAKIRGDIEVIKGIDAGTQPYLRTNFKAAIQGRILRAANRGEVENVNKMLDVIRKANETMSKKIFTTRHSIWNAPEIAKSKQQIKAKPGVESTLKEYDGAEIKSVPEDDRVRIFFDGIPSAAVRTDLKKSGWRWSPRNEAWQRKLTSNAERSAAQILDKHYKVADTAVQKPVVEKTAIQEPVVQKPIIKEPAKVEVIEKEVIPTKGNVETLFEARPDLTRYEGSVLNNFEQTDSAVRLHDIVIRKELVSKTDMDYILKTMDTTSVNSPKTEQMINSTIHRNISVGEVKKFKPIQIDVDVLGAEEFTVFKGIGGMNYYVDKAYIPLLNSIPGDTAIIGFGYDPFIAKVSNGKTQIAIKMNQLNENELYIGSDVGIAKRRALSREMVQRKELATQNIPKRLTNTGITKYGVNKVMAAPGKTNLAEKIEGINFDSFFTEHNGVIGYHLFDKKEKYVGSAPNESEARKMLYLADKRNFGPEEKTIKLQSTSDFNRLYQRMHEDYHKNDGVGEKEIMATSQALDELVGNLNVMPVYNYKTAQGEIYRGKVTALNIAKKMIYEGKVDLEGMEFDSMDDLAAKLMILRNPMFETSRKLFLKNGKVLNVDSSSSRLPNHTSVGITNQAGIKAVVDKAIALGADEIIVMHNHPTGSVTPSSADKRSTAQLSKYFSREAKDKGYKLKCDTEIVINHNKYTMLKSFEGGQVRVSTEDVKNVIFKEDLITSEVVNFIGLPTKEMGSLDLFKAAKYFNQNENVFSIIYSTVQNTVVSVEEFDLDILNDYKAIESHLDKMAKHYMSSRVFMVLPDSLKFSMDSNVSNLIKKGYLSEAMGYRNGESVRTRNRDHKKTVARLNKSLNPTKGFVVYEPSVEFTMTDDFIQENGLYDYDNSADLLTDLQDVLGAVENVGYLYRDEFDAWVESGLAEKPEWANGVLEYEGDEIKYAIQRINQIVEGTYNPDEWNDIGYPVEAVEYEGSVEEIDNAIFDKFPEDESLSKATGWILPSGRMVNLGDGQQSRTLDHRSISTALQDIEGETEWSDGMELLLDKGAIRYFPEGNGMHVTQPLNKAQKAAVYNMIEMEDGEVFVFLSQPGEHGTSAKEHMFEIGTTPEQVFSAIESFYGDGELSTFMVEEPGIEYNDGKDAAPKWYKKKKEAIEKRAEKLKTSVDKAVFDTLSVDKTDAAIDKDARKNLHDLDRYAREVQRVKDVRGSEREKYKAKILDSKLKQKAKTDATKQKKSENEERKKLMKTIKTMDKFNLPPELQKMYDEVTYDIDTAAMNISRRTVERTNALKESVKYLKDTVPGYAAENSVLAKIERLNKQHTGQMGIEEIRELQDIVNHIAETYKDLVSIKKGIERTEITSVVNDFNKANGASGIIDGSISESIAPGKPKRRNPITATKETLFTVGALSPRVEIAKLVKFDKTNSFYKLFYDNLNEGGKKSLEFSRDASLFFNEKDGYTEINGIKTTSWFGNDAKLEVIKLSPTRTISLSKGDRMAMYLHSLNTGNIKHLVNGGFNYTKEAGPKLNRIDYFELKTIIDSMTPDELTVSRMIHMFFDTLAKDALNTASNETLYYDVAGVKNYFPIVTSEYFRKSDFNAYNIDTSIEGMGFLKPRVDSKMPIMLVNALDQLQMSINQISKYYGFAKPVKDMEAVMNFKGIQGSSQIRLAIERNYSTADWKYITTLLSDVKGNYYDKGDVEKVLNKMTNNVQAAVLSYNPVVVIKQLASIPYAAARIEPKFLAEAVGKKADWGEWVKRSGVVWIRTKGAFSRSSKEALDANELLKKVTKFGMSGIKSTDLGAINVLLKAAELKATSLGLTGEAWWTAALEIGEPMVQDTQPNYPTVQRTGHGRSHNIAVRWLGMFRTAIDQAYNLTYESIGILANSDKFSSEEVINAKNGLVGVAIGGALVAFINAAKEKVYGYDVNMTELIVSSYLGMFYGISDAADIAISGYGVEAMPLAALTDAGLAIVSLLDPAGSRNVLGEIANTMEKVGSLFGASIHNLNRNLRTVLRLIDPDLLKEYDAAFKKSTGSKSKTPSRSTRPKR